MSKFGLYFFGYMLGLSAFYAGNAIMTANKLGAIVKPFFFNDWTIYGILAACVILEIIDTFAQAAGRQQSP